MAEQQERILLAEYQEKLKMGSFIVPDPLNVVTISKTIVHF